jgi:hypothetical protein
LIGPAGYPRRFGAGFASSTVTDSRESAIVTVGVVTSADVARFIFRFGFGSGSAGVSATAISDGVNPESTIFRNA